MSKQTERAATTGWPQRPGLGPAALLCGALVWGLIWYPYRALAAGGLPGLPATALTYFVALLVALVVWPVLGEVRRHWRVLLPIGLAAAVCNIGFVLATLHGEVMRALLLFYLAPLWTVPLAWLLLRERPGGGGVWVIVLSLTGAATMLWQPAIGLPLPQHLADWLGLLAGAGFALFNVLSRRAEAVSGQGKALASFAAVSMVGMGLTVALGVFPSPAALSGQVLLLLTVVGGILVAVNLVVQYGLAAVPANRAIVLMMTEVAVATLAAWGLENEVPGLREWIGGAMILAATLLAARGESGG